MRGRSKSWWHLGKVIKINGGRHIRRRLRVAEAPDRQSQRSARERASVGRFPRRNEVVDISSLPQWHGAPVLSADNVVTIYTGLRRWRRDRNWRPWLVLCFSAALLP